MIYIFFLKDVIFFEIKKFKCFIAPIQSTHFFNGGVLTFFSYDSVKIYDTLIASNHNNSADTLVFFKIFKQTIYNFFL